MEYTDLNGDNCVLTIILYKIISNYRIVTLHNLTQDKVITDPADYYQSLADRKYGMEKIKYINLKGEVLAHSVEMSEAILSVLETGKNTGNGVYVNAATLNRNS